MKFVVDAQLPPALAKSLAQARHQAWHVEEVGLRDAEDSQIWRYAVEHQAIILTKDEDFAVRLQQHQNAPVIVWLRIGNCSKAALLAWFMPLLPAIIREIESGQRLIEVR